MSSNKTEYPREQSLVALYLVQIYFGACHWQVIFYAGKEVTGMAMRKLKKYKPTKFKAKDSHYDSDAADFAVMFIESLCHTKGTWAGKSFELIDWQEPRSSGTCSER